MIGMGISKAVADSYLEMYAGFETGAIAPEAPAKLERTPTTFEEFVANVFLPATREIAKQ
jgi:hypothetical protein